MAGNKSWDEVRRTLALDEERVAQFGRLGEIEERIYEICGRRGVSEAAMAATLGVDPSNAWTIPAGDDLYMFALARHVAAAGGRLEVRAVFDDDDVLLLREPPSDGGAQVAGGG